MNRPPTSTYSLIRYCNVLLLTVCIITVSFEVAARDPFTEREKDHYVYSAIRGTISAADTITFRRKIKSIRWLGGDSSAFQAMVNGSNQLVLTYRPSKDFIGISRTKLRVEFRTNDSRTIELTGLSTRALEGENEAPLATILQALRYPVNVGWETLANHCRPELEGEEVRGQLFRKVGKGKVSMIPLARYSPDFKLGFGYYVATDDSVTKHEAGVLSLAGKHPEHQTLYPAHSINKSFPDPGNKAFGFYAESPTHTAFTQDTLNARLFPKYVVHAARVYPLKNSKGVAQPNTFLVCFEEAKNGDYNDYVFIVTNVEMVMP
ncbi:MAG: hypothetical protein EOO04_04275 [Chitinophagaceae bacterium]|nr:MAG: hypothetical protein EOO04_04275 [Chitinophagaceae bacterium]